MSDSPLLPFVDDDRGLAAFAVGAPAGGALDDLGPAVLAGVAEVDITPPPGMPKAGYSRNAHDGIGFRTRLRARAFHLRAGTTSLAVVTLDLLGGSSVLQRLVAEQVAATTDVPLHGLFLGATHTHAGPGQFQGSPFYAHFASNRPGFDPAFAQFLVARISGAVVEAVETRRPARVAVGSTEVWGLTRNRSLAPHVRNATVPDRSRAAHRKFVAVNPHLHLVRIDDADGPMGALATFSIHGTGISQHAHEYNADIWAYLVGALADGVERSTGTRPVTGAMEATHADVAPAIRPGQAGYLEAERIGRGIGEQAAALHASLEGELAGELPLAAGLREIDLGLGFSVAAADGHVLAPPAIGAAQVAGAKENLTPVLGWLPPFRAGMPRPFGGRRPQGAKWLLLSDRRQKLILPKADFPTVMPLQVLRLGHTVLVGAPFEITVESGRRVQAAVLAATRTAGVDDVVVSSVANEYWGYCATPEEYELQYYEGGHTLHGPSTQPWLAAQLARLAGDVVHRGQVVDVDERGFALPARRYLPRTTGVAVRRRADGPAEFHDPDRTDEGYWEVRWHDVAAGDLCWHEPLARVELEDGSVVADDQGTRVAVLQLKPGTYSARWYGPPLGRVPKHRFVLPANAGQPEIRTELFG